MLLRQEKCSFAKAASKPSQMALGLLDNLFSTDVLKKSTVHETKDFVPLNPETISAINGRFIAHTFAT